MGDDGEVMGILGRDSGTCEFIGKDEDGVFGPCGTVMPYFID